MADINPIAQEQIDKIKTKCENIKPLVVIRCITYNHEKYIRDALDGFVMQKTDFPFVAIVHDDASTDKTAGIIKEYADKYPDKILPILEKENQHSKRDGSLGQVINTACFDTGAKYIAFCEGDDYWTDPLKLQKQVDFLKAHQDIDYTCHRYSVQTKNLPEHTLYPNSYLDTFPSKEGFEFDLQYVFKNDWITKTLTSLFRIECLKYNELKGCYYYRDLHFIYQILSRSNGYCFQFNGGVYRKQETGTWSQSDPVKNAYIEVKSWESIYERIPTKFNRWKIRNNYTRYMIIALKSKKMFKISNMREFIDMFYFPIEYYKIKGINSKEIKRISKFELNKQ